MKVGMPIAGPAEAAPKTPLASARHNADCPLRPFSGQVTLFAPAEGGTQSQDGVLTAKSKALDEFLDLLVGGVGVGYAVDLLDVLRHLLVQDSPEPSFAMVVGNEKGGISETGIVLSLGIHCAVDVDVVRLALYYYQR